MKLKELCKLSKELGISIEFRDRHKYGIGGSEQGCHFRLENDWEWIVNEIKYTAERDGFTDFYLYV